MQWKVMTSRKNNVLVSDRIEQSAIIHHLQDGTQKPNKQYNENLRVGRLETVRAGCNGGNSALPPTRTDTPSRRACG